MITRIVTTVILLASLIDISVFAAEPGPPLPVNIAYQADLGWLQFAARELKLFEKVGLAPTHVKFLAGAPMIAAAQGQSIDIAVPGLVPFLTGRGQGVDWVIIGVDAAGATQEGFVARQDAGIQTLADLKGKRIGYFRASTAHYGLVTGLRKNRIGLDQVTLLQMPPAQQLAAMVNKDIDAAEVWEPWMQKMVHGANGKVVALEADLGLFSAVGSIAVRRDWLASHRETASRFMTALMLAAEALKRDPSPGIRVVAQEMGIPQEWAAKMYKDEPPAIERWLDPTYPYSLAAGGGMQKSLDDIAQFLYEEKVVTKPVSASGVIDNSVIAEVLKTSKR
jgi:taurine transport system substrate-binding protein